LPDLAASAGPLPMGDSGPDGGSEASYESVASEGAYEPAAERGRDPLPRIISSSNCVEVFRRLRWDSGINCRPVSPDKREQEAKANRTIPPHNPLHTLPQRIMRFDGAMEAWLEEMPLPVDLHSSPMHYGSLSDAAERRPELSVLQAGNQAATIWYFTMEFLQQLWPMFISSDDAGLKYWERALLERGCHITSTHIEVGRVDCPVEKTGKARTQWLKALFSALQTKQWSPNCEARLFLHKRRLTHAAMSIGDAVQIGSKLYFVTLAGFTEVKDAANVLPPGSFDPNEVEAPSQDLGEPEPAAPSREGKKKNKKKNKGNKWKPVDREESGEDEEEEDHADASNGVEGGKTNGKKGNGRRNRGKNNGKGDGAQQGAEEQATKGGKGAKGGDESGRGKGEAKGGDENGKGKGANGKSKGKGEGQGGDNARGKEGKGKGRAALRKQIEANKNQAQTSSQW